MRLAMLLLILSSAPALSQPSPPAGFGPPPGMKPPGKGKIERVFLTPMGEPIRKSPDGKAAFDLWFDGADRDASGTISLVEMTEDARRFFALLDVNKDGAIGWEERKRYETEIAPEPLRRMALGGGGRPPRPRSSGGGMSGGGPPSGGMPGGGGPGGGMPGGGPPGGGGPPEGASPAGGTRSMGGMPGLPQPVAMADRDLNGIVTLKEFESTAAKRFAARDANHNGSLERGEMK